MNQLCGFGPVRTGDRLQPRCSDLKATLNYLCLTSEPIFSHNTMMSSKLNEIIGQKSLICSSNFFSFEENTKKTHLIMHLKYLHLNTLSQQIKILLRVKPKELPNLYFRL